MKLTAESARLLQPGQQLKCHVVTGLELRARQTVKSWHLYYRSPTTGDRRHPKIGEFPSLPIEAAREAARKLLRLIAGGADPSAQKQSARDAPLISELCKQFLETVATRSKSTVNQYGQVIRLHILPRWGKMRVSEFTAADARAGLRAISKTAPQSANMVRVLLRSMCSLAEKEELGWRPVNSNPINADVPRNPSFARRRYVTPDEARRIASAMRELAPQYPAHIAAITCILYAGSRITELTTATWSMVEAGSIVRRDHKGARTGNVRTIRLPRQAWAVIDRLPRQSRYIFGASLDRWQIQAVWDRVRSIAEVPDIQVRDLRRTFATVAKSRGVSLAQIGEIFDHQQSATTERYAYIFEDTADKTVQHVADEIENILLPRPE